jgi:hypothetical protein
MPLASKPLRKSGADSPSQVCHLWKNITDDTTELWHSPITINAYADAYGIYNMEKFVQRYTKVELDILFDPDGRTLSNTGYERVLTILQGCKRRIRSIEIKGTSRRLYGQIVPLINSLHTLPNIEYIGIGRLPNPYPRGREQDRTVDPQLEPILLSIVTPSLRQFSCYGVQAQPMPSSHPSNIDSPEGNSVSLSHSTSCTVLSSRLTLLDITFFAASTSKPPPLLDQILDFPQLKRLRLFDFDGAFQFLLGSRCPQLETLTVIRKIATFTASKDVQRSEDNMVCYPSLRVLRIYGVLSATFLKYLRARMATPNLQALYLQHEADSFPSREPSLSFELVPSDSDHRGKAELPHEPSGQALFIIFNEGIDVDELKWFPLANVNHLSIVPGAIGAKMKLPPLMIRKHIQESWTMPKLRRLTLLHKSYSMFLDGTKHPLAPLIRAELQLSGVLHDFRHMLSQFHALEELKLHVDSQGLAAGGLRILCEHDEVSFQYQFKVMLTSASPSKPASTFLPRLKFLTLAIHKDELRSATLSKTIATLNKELELIISCRKKTDTPLQRTKVDIPVL